MGPAQASAQWQFATVKGFVDGTDGWAPAGPMVQAADGFIYGLPNGYGLPASGGSSQCASAFRFRVPQELRSSAMTHYRLDRQFRVAPSVVCGGGCGEVYRCGARTGRIRQKLV